jgi:hypothetical protein
MSPLEFMQRLAALVPRPRLPLIRFHGVLAAHAKLRSEIIPSPSEDTSERSADHALTYLTPAHPGTRPDLRRADSITKWLDP